MRRQIMVFALGVCTIMVSCAPIGANNDPMFTLQVSSTPSLYTTMAFTETTVVSSTPSVVETNIPTLETGSIEGAGGSKINQWTPTEHPIGATPTLIPQVTLQEERKTYPIFGSTAEALRAELDKKGIKDDFGTWDAYASWDLGWTYDYIIEENKCSVGKTSVVVITKFVLPEWKAPPEASDELRKYWDTYMAAVAQHEEGHRVIAMQAGQELYRLLQSLPPQMKCTWLKKNSDRLGQSVLDMYNQKDILYDLLTDHGITQGAVFR